MLNQWGGYPAQGKIVWQERISDLPAGLHHLQFNGAHIAPGSYVMTIKKKKALRRGGC